MGCAIIRVSRRCKYKSALRSGECTLQGKESKDVSYKTWKSDVSIPFLHANMNHPKDIVSATVLFPRPNDGTVGDNKEEDLH